MDSKPKIYRKSREDLKTRKDGLMAICPARPSLEIKEGKSGEAFLLEYGAWGFIRICKEPDYFGLYVSSPVSAIKYFGVIDQVKDPNENDHDIDGFREHESYEEGYKILTMKNDLIVELNDLIPLEGPPIQGLRYTTLTKFIEAETTSDLW